MDEQTAIEKLSLFFYFSFMDEGRAHSATIQGIKRIRRRFPSGIPKQWQSVVVEECQHVLRSKKEFGILSRVGFVQGHVKFPEGSNWGPWFEFRKLSDPDSFATVIWIKILGLSVEDVAKGLNVTIGTIQHRLGKALKDLGQFIQVGTTP